MVSATFDSQSPPLSTAPVPLAQVKQFAAAGYFKAIALWVNQPLVPYGIYAQIKHDARPGCLHIILEFKRPPRKERLVRLLCSRLWQLHSELIEGVHITARPIGQTRVAWQRRVRLRRSVAQPVAPQPASKPDRPVNMRWAQRQPMRRSAQRAMRRSRTAVDRQFKIVRAALLSGSVAAAFVAGCLTEGMMSRSPSLPNLPTPNNRPQTADPIQGTSVAYTQPDPAEGAPRANSIQAALEPVAVMPHDQVQDPTDPTVTLMFGGEVTLGNVDLSAPDTADRLLQGLPAYAQADVSMVNLGNPLATAGTSIQEGYYRRTRPEAVAALKQGGIDIVGLASDRTMDLGEQGLLETLTTLDQAGIYRVGAGRDQQEARRPEILDVKGQRIAYLSYHTAPRIPATKTQAGTNQPTRTAVVEDIAAIRNAVDWVVVNYRWVDDELDTEPTSEQVALSRRAIDAGADLVVGYHPHQLQGAEVYKGRAIVYALGDFIFSGAPLEDRETATLRVSLKPQQMKVEFLPVTVRRAQPLAATGEQGEAILQEIRQASAQLEHPLDFPAVLTARPAPTAKPAQVVDETPSLGGELEPSEGSPALFETLELDPQAEGGWPSAPTPLNGVTPTTKELTPSESWIDSGPAIGPGLEAHPDTDFSPVLQLEDQFEGGVEERSTNADDRNADDSVGDSFINETNEDFIEQSDIQLSPLESPNPRPPLRTPESAPAVERPVETSPTSFPKSVTPQLPKLDNWGPKQSPHQEFRPIRNDQPDTADAPTPGLLPADAHPHPEPATPATEAIGPYSEPLVGPLSQQLLPFLGDLMRK